MNELQEIAESLKVGKPARSMSVRTFLGLFGQSRRGFKVVSRIRKELKKHNLATEPDFENENIDNRIRIFLQDAKPTPEGSRVPQASSEKEATPGHSDRQPASVEGENSSAEPREAVVTIRQGIPAAGKAPATVRPEEPVLKALSRLMSEKLELLVVQRGERARVEGIFNYASYTHAHLAGKTPKVVGDCISQEFIEVNEEKPLIEAVREITKHGTVFVRSRQNLLCGVVTARDVAPVFIELAEPFLLLGQIENHLRGLMERGKLTKVDYKTFVEETDINRLSRTEGPDDLTLGELIRGFERDEIWKKTGLQFDKALFTKRLHEVRLIRNRVMHFSPDGLPPEDVTLLKEARELLGKL